VSALSLHSQLETSNRFLEIASTLRGDELECPDQPRPVAAAHRPRPGRAAPRLAAGPGSTERSACGIVTDLTAAGYAAKQKDGRRNRYQRLRPRTLRRSWRMTGTSARMRPEAGKVILSPAFVIRVRDHRPVMASRPGPARRAQWRGQLAGRAVCLGWDVLSGGRRVSSRGTVAVSPVRRMSRPADAEPSRLRAGLAGGRRSLGLTVIAGAGMLSGSQFACPGDPGRGVPAAGCAGQPRPDG
jgi:hypothetical protein